MPKLTERLLPLILALAPACFLSRTTVDEPLRKEQLARFVPGETTAKDVVEALGAPNEVVQLGTRSAYRYDFTVEKTAGFTLIIITFLNDDTRADRAWLFFDKDDVLTHAGSTLQASGTEYAMPWQTIHGR